MDDNDMMVGFTMGIAFIFLLFIVLLHMAEYVCQEENNVYDCSLGFTMTPVEVVDD